MKYTREDLTKICERAIVPVERWMNRDTPSAQLGVYQALGLLKAGCEFSVTYTGKPGDPCVTDKRTIWLYIQHPTFSTFEWGNEILGELHVYLPTEKRLNEVDGQDWY